MEKRPARYNKSQGERATLKVIGEEVFKGREHRCGGGMVAGGGMEGYSTAYASPLLIVRKKTKNKTKQKERVAQVYHENWAQHENFI